MVEIQIPRMQWMLPNRPTAAAPPGEGEEGAEAPAGDEGGEGEGTEEELPVGAIDAYWLQRECSRYFNDPLLAQKVAEVRLKGRDRRERRSGRMEDGLMGWRAERATCGSVCVRAPATVRE